jgi:DNA-binding CsgD family transcriptional regulator
LTQKEDQLTAREWEILRLIANGLTTKQVANTLDISFKTAAAHRGRLMNKLGIHEVAGLTVYAIRHGIVSLQSDPSSTQELLFEQVRRKHVLYRQALDAYSSFLRERESIGLSNPDSVTGARRLQQAEQAAAREYQGTLNALRLFLQKQ